VNETKTHRGFIISERNRYQERIHNLRKKHDIRKNSKPLKETYPRKEFIEDDRNKNPERINAT